MLDNNTLKTELKKLLADCKTGEKSSDDFADGLVDALGKWIKTATVDVDVSTTVTGACTSPSGAGTITGSGTGTGTKDGAIS